MAFGIENLDLEGTADLVAGVLGEFEAGTGFLEHVDRFLDRALDRLDATEEQSTAIRAIVDSTIDVNLKGCFNYSRAVARTFREQGSGRIVNTTSIAGLKGNFGQSNYSAAKAGLYGLTLTNALELAKYGVTVNAIAPIAKTRMTDDIDSIGDDLLPEDVSPVVVFLCSDLAKDVTGRIFGVHGKHLFEYNMQTSPGARRDTDWTIDSIAESLNEISNFGDTPSNASPSPQRDRDRSDLEPDIACAHRHQFLAWLKFSPDGIRVGDGTNVVNPGETGSGEIEPPDKTAGCEHQSVIVERSAVFEYHASGRRLQAFRANTELQGDVAVCVEFRRPQMESLGF